jgi:hypothetical protein
MYNIINKARREPIPVERGNKMKNKSKVLVETEFKDSLKEGNFSVRIIRHDNNIVFGECVEVKIEHDTEPEFSINETYQPDKFPGDFYGDLAFRGWSFVLEKINEELFKKVSFVRIFIPPEEWGKHNDGGDYAFSVKYSRCMPGEQFKVSYWCSGSVAFDWCEVYGFFQSCKNCSEYELEEGGCCAAPVLVSESQVLEVLKNLDERDEVEELEYF